MTTSGPTRPDILDRLANGSMPCDGAWPAPQIDVFRRWTESGTPA